MTDQDTLNLLRRVDALRAELRQLEPQLRRECIAFGKRRGCSMFQEHHLRNPANVLELSDA